MLRRFGTIAAAGICAWILAGPALAQAPTRGLDDAPPGVKPIDGDLYALDFNNVELAVVIDAIAKLTNKNFIYDDRVRGRVTIVSPTPMTIEQAYAVFESVLQVKGFTTVTSPGGAIKVIPVREAKESNIETVRSSLPPPDRDRFVTRLIPLRYIDAESIVNTLKPLVSKDASMAAYVETNTVILTESASNIRRLLAILEAIDVETYKEELAVLKVEFADATVLAEQVSQIYGAEVSAATGSGLTPQAGGRRAGVPGAAPAPAANPTRGRVRIITDGRTNSLIVLAARAQLDDVRDLVRKLDVPVTGGGRIHVYYLQYADAEELAQTLAALISGQATSPRTGTGGGGLGGSQPGGIPQVQGAQTLRTAVSALAEGISVTADPATNALVIQASQEGYATIAGVIEKLDIERPQVLVEALIMEVDITDGTELGFNGLFRLINGDTDITIAQVTDGAATGAALGGPFGAAGGAALPLFVNFFRRTFDVDAMGTPVDGSDGSLIQGIIRAAASDAGTNIISAPHILTSDNEEAEIRIGNNIPIISSRVQAPTTGGTVDDTGLSTSVNVERQDIGVTLRVTPQITEGDSLRLDIFQEITSINKALQVDVGDVNEVGPPLASRKVENTVMVGDGETVVIGGLISDVYEDTTTKVPWLGDIPFLGWAFKTTSRNLNKANLLVFLTPHIVRTRSDLEHETIRKREEFENQTGPTLELSQDEIEEATQQRDAAEAAGEVYVPPPGRNPVRNRLLEQEARYPLERMREIEQQKGEARERARAEAGQAGERYLVQAPVLGDEAEAMQMLTELVDAGFDGTLVSNQTAAGIVLYEIRLGPFETLEEAQKVGVVVQSAHGLSSSVLVEPAPAPEEEP
ncbi:MAG TPA: type II secretion system secretin GspD [Myxococcota bacterium]